ncbi:MAG: tRNA (adenosine(37)-N6)-dimethylallyltransferase MiaA [Phycisphaerae bacterium]
MADATPILVITGPTASGKERLALAVAERLDGEIISADSMKVYRGLDVGTAKPSPEDRRRVPHHAIDVADPDETFSAARWLELADAAVADVRACGKVTVVSGGTPFYLKALLEGLFEGPDADPALRRRLRDEAEERGSAHLHARLARVDPEAAGRIHPNDLRRIVRALEVHEKTGRPISDLQRQWGERRPEYRPLLVALRRSRDDLTRRITDRARRMLDGGLVEEVRTLLDRWGHLAKGPSQALGYAEVLAYLRGDLAEDDLLDAVVAHTRQFARRQTSWLRRFEGVTWLSADPDTPTAALADRVVGLWQAHANQDTREDSLAQGRKQPGENTA